ncbi:ComF family protein [Arthrobacter crystallopoietes]|uniref:ComF family protein n=1 Tax=Crystallibacter crystallopoietes TaxID=37928 RepID=UPI001ABDE08B|nr:phosphoribosyltransferase family protein [Arthrobacter crystallopoietes]QTG80642.1 ComF family protein [Arthrobacter crystallopoietes]
MWFPAALFDAVYFHAAVQRVLRWIAEFGHLVLPTDCVSCGAEDHTLCPPCRSRLRRATVRPYRAEDGAESLPFVGTDFAEVLPVMAAGRYRHELSQAILAYKNQGRTDLLHALAPALAAAVHAAAHIDGGHPRVFLVPVPSRTSSRRRRGYDPLDLLLRRLERQQLLPPELSVLRAACVRSGIAGLAKGIVPAASQKSLGKSGRRSNVSSSMRIKRRYTASLQNRHCILVDDVLTTGATLAELTRALHEAGAVVDAGVVVAATSAPSGTA